MQFLRVDKNNFNTEDCKCSVCVCVCVCVCVYRVRAPVIDCRTLI